MNSRSSIYGGAVYIKDISFSGLQTDEIPIYFSNHPIEMSPFFSLSPSLTIKANKFENCSSHSGAIYFDSKLGEMSSFLDELLSENIFVNNSAVYGANISTPPFDIIPFKNPNYMFIQHLFSLNFILKDYFNNTIIYNLNDTSLLPSLFLSPGTNNSLYLFGNPHPAPTLFSNQSISFSKLEQNGFISNQ
jgi:hypothetical protein